MAVYFKVSLVTLCLSLLIAVATSRPQQPQAAYLLVVPQAATVSGTSQPQRQGQYYGQNSFPQQDLTPPEQQARQYWSQPLQVLQEPYENQQNLVRRNRQLPGQGVPPQIPQAPRFMNSIPEASQPSPFVLPPFPTSPL